MRWTMPVVSFPVLHATEHALPKNCAGDHARCGKCRLFMAKVCPGCSAVGGLGRCRMAACDTQCGQCGGYNVDTPAICTKSPMRDMMLDKVSDVAWDKIPKGRTVNLKNKAILVMNGGKRPMFRDSIDPKRYADIEAVGVSLWRVWSTRGWFSSDLKDYLGLPKHVKLVLSTSVYDDSLERATTWDVMPEAMERKDVDLCMPLSYSIFTDDGVINQWFAWRRRLRAMEDVGGDFIIADPLVVSTMRDVQEAVKRVPQVMFHTQNNSAQTADGVAVSHRWYRALHASLPKHVSFWFQGTSSPRHVAQFKRMFVGRPLYFMTSSPWMAAHKGHEFTKGGKMKRSKLPQDELTVRAFENYSAIVQGV